MKLEKQVTSLKLSKKLKELGVQQDSHWMWVKYEFWKKPQVLRSDLATDIKLACLSGKREWAFSAFTVAELGEKLRKANPRWCDLPASKTINDKTEANARAKMLIYLIENNLMEGKK